jgi:hypothetical protein
MGLDKSRLARPVCPGPHHSFVAALMAARPGSLPALRLSTAQLRLGPQWNVGLVMQEELEPR